MAMASLAMLNYQKVWFIDVYCLLLYTSSLDNYKDNYLYNRPLKWFMIVRIVHDSSWFYDIFNGSWHWAYSTLSSWLDPPTNGGWWDQWMSKPDDFQWFAVTPEGTTLPWPSPRICRGKTQKISPHLKPDRPEGLAHKNMYKSYWERKTCTLLYKIITAHVFEMTCCIKLHKLCYPTCLISNRKIQHTNNKA